MATFHLSSTEEPVRAGRYLVQKCGSGVDYPTQGDEAVNLNHGGLGYHVRILHPKVVDGPHFSSPYFWVSEEGEVDFTSLISVIPHIGGLSWNSIFQAYFFAEEKALEGEPLRGFFLEDGRENADWGSAGLLFLFDGEKSHAWRWNYLRDPSQTTGKFEIVDANDPDEPASPPLMKRISDVLDFVEKEANAWPGP